MRNVVDLPCLPLFIISVVLSFSYVSKKLSALHMYRALTEIWCYIGREPALGRGDRVLGPGGGGSRLGLESVPTCTVYTEIAI